MKILHIVGTMNAGGIERIVSQLAQAQKQHGHLPAVACIMAAEGIFKTELENLSIPVINCSCPSKKPWVLSLNLHKAIQEFKPDIIHSHVNFSLPWQFFSITPSFKKPVVITQHTTSASIEKLSYRIKSRLIYYFFNTLFNLTFTGVSEYSQSFVHRLYGISPKDVVLVRNGIKPDLFRYQDGDRNEIRSSLGIPDGCFLIGCVGRFDHVKGHDILLNSFSRVVNAIKHPNLSLMLIGTGTLQKKLKQLADNLGLMDKIYWIGETENVAKYLSACDLYVQPSRIESLSLTILEALANGLQVVATNTGGAMEIAGFSANILLAQDISVLSLSESLMKYFESKKLSRSTGSYLPSEFIFSRMVEQYESLYKKLVNND